MGWDEPDLCRRGGVGDVHDVDARSLSTWPPRAFRVERTQVRVAPKRAHVTDAAGHVRELELADQLDVRAGSRQMAAHSAMLVLVEGLGRLDGAIDGGVLGI